MFQWFHDYRVRRILEGAEQFLADTKKADMDKFWEKLKKEKERTKPREPQIQYSRRDYDEVRYDPYDEESVDRAVKALSGRNAPVMSLLYLSHYTNRSFVEKMLEYISMKSLKETEVYKAAHIDRRLFSKIASDKKYKPSKDTCIAIALALHLDLEEANDLLARAGFVLSHSIERDIVVEYFFRERIYNVDDVNEVLVKLKQKPLGRQ